MNNLDLLVMAAKAVGIKHVDYKGVDYDGKDGLILVDHVGRHLSDWNPINDDGEALRIAVKLRFKIHHAEMAAIVVPEKFSHSWIGVSDDDAGDRYAATRLAIVKAAAAIGKTLP